MKPFSTIAAAVLALMAIVHVARIATGFDVTIADHTVPLWFNAVGAVVGFVLAVGLWRESRS